MAGTAYRPLTAALCLGRGTFRLMGSERMTERPIADLVDALRPLGAQIDYLGRDGFPPLRVHGTGLRGGNVRMRGNVSSQFLTSLMMAAPLADGPISVTIEGEQVSKPYLDITLNLMQRFGIHASHDQYRRFDIPNGQLPFARVDSRRGRRVLSNVLSRGRRDSRRPGAGARHRS